MIWSYQLLSYYYESGPIHAYELMVTYTGQEMYCALVTISTNKNFTSNFSECSSPMELAVKLDNDVQESIFKSRVFSFKEIGNVWLPCVNVHNIKPEQVHIYSHMLQFLLSVFLRSDVLWHVSHAKHMNILWPTTHLMILPLMMN